jgi:hypothetical protein
MVVCAVFPFPPRFFFPGRVVVAFLRRWFDSSSALLALLLALPFLLARYGSNPRAYGRRYQVNLNARNFQVISSE